MRKSYGRRDFELRALEISSIPEDAREQATEEAVAVFKATSKFFDEARFRIACHPVPQADYRMEVEFRELEFTISLRFPEADVDMAIVPSLTALYCGNVTHECGVADLAGGGYDAGKAECTPIAAYVCAFVEHMSGSTYDFKKSRYVNNLKGLPDGVDPHACTSHFIQGYADIGFKYTGVLAHLQAAIEKTRRLVELEARKFIRYHKSGDTAKNSSVSVFAGTGSDIRRVA